MRSFYLLALISFFAMTVSANKRPVTVFLAGDSTCAEKLPEKRPETGWGEKFGQYFKDDKVKIENRAMNGRSTKTFISEGRWQKIVDEVRKGDYVFVQFGHNDSAKEKGERYTPPEDYRKNLIKFINEIQAKKANMVLLTPVMRRRFDEQGKFYDTHGEYPEIVRSVAKEFGVKLIDMHRSSEKLLVSLGEEESKKLFLILKPGESENYPNGLNDNTHFNPTGAEEMAKLAVAALRTEKIGLRKYLKKQ